MLVDRNSFKTSVRKHTRVMSIMQDYSAMEICSYWKETQCMTPSMLGNTRILASANWSSLSHSRPTPQRWDTWSGWQRWQAAHHWSLGWPRRYCRSRYRWLQRGMPGCCEGPIYEHAATVMAYDRDPTYKVGPSTCQTEKKLTPK